MEMGRCLVSGEMYDRMFYIFSVKWAASFSTLSGSRSTLVRPWRTELIDLNRTYGYGCFFEMMPEKYAELASFTTFW